MEVQKQGRKKQRIRNKIRRRPLLLLNNTTTSNNNSTNNKCCWCWCKKLLLNMLLLYILLLLSTDSNVYNNHNNKNAFFLLGVEAKKTKTKTKTKQSLSSSFKYSQICGSNYPKLDIRGEYIVRTLLSISGKDSLILSTSPQHLGMCWMIYDDPLQLISSKGKNWIKSLSSLSSWLLFPIGGGWLWGSKNKNEWKRFKQRYGLVVLYYATGGGNSDDGSLSNKSKWIDKTNWLSKKHECTWYGITCNWYSRVVGIDLSYNELTGVIPREISLFKKTLTNLNLYANEISGILPSHSLSELKLLRVLKLHINSFIGTLPATIGQLKQLRELSLYGNYFQGELPKAIGNLRKLELLDLSANLFSGTPPNTMSNMKNLEEVYLDNNDFTGYIKDNTKHGSKVGARLGRKKKNRNKNKSKNTKTFTNKKINKNSRRQSKTNNKKKKKDDTLCSLTKLEILQADCLALTTTTNSKAEIQCDCCTICCHDKAEPRCVDMI